VSCNLVENINISRHALYVESPIVYLECHMTRVVSNEKIHDKTCDHYIDELSYKSYMIFDKACK
jgi:hypothetical protein